VVLAALAAATVALAASEPAAPAGAPGRIEQAIARRVDEIRVAHRLRPLARDAALARVARRHACWMAGRGRLSHEGPAGETLAERVRAAGRSYQTVAENLASSVNAADPVTAAIDGWMGSRGHRDNILREDVTRTGVGVCRRGPAYYVAQVFLRPG
jgi:uncharacterized protein YkwD